MRRPIQFLAVALFAWALAIQPASAQEAKKPAAVAVKVAIIDIDEIMRKASVAKSIRDQHQSFREKVQATIKDEEEELRTANQELARKRSLLSPEAFAEERKKFEERLMQVQRGIQERKHQLDTAQGEAMKKVQETLNEIVIDVANEHNLTLIFRADQLVFWAKPLDITPEVLKRLDKKLPKVDLDLPKQAG